MPSTYGGSSVYGGPNLYGGTAPLTSPAIAIGVGTKFDIALNNIGLRLAPGQKAYKKSAAPTFGYNLRNQLSSQSRMSARDLFFWNRWEHSDWTSGESTSVYVPGTNDSGYSSSTGFDVTQSGKLVHLPVVASGKTLTASMAYANFVEDLNGNLWINDANTNMWYSSDGGVTWTAVVIPASDTTTIQAVWSSGAKIFVATTTNLYAGTTAGLATFITKVDGVNGTVLAGVLSGTYYNGAHYVGVGTKMLYIDSAGVATTEFDTTSHNVTLIQGYQGKIYFGGAKGTNSRLWTWTWTGAPPTPTNGSGAEIQQGTLPAGFVVTAMTVYLNLLELGGYFPGAGGAGEGIGAVYYINGSIFGQLLQLGKKQTGRSYAVRSLFGYNNFLVLGYNHKTGVGIYDFSHGAFSAGVSTTYTDSPNNETLAVCVHKNRYYFLVKNDGKIWRSGDNLVSQATIDSLEFTQVAFIAKLIDGHELSHAALNGGESVELWLSFDNGATWNQSGVNNLLNSMGGNIALRNTRAQHWRSRLVSNQNSTVPTVPIWSDNMETAGGAVNLWKSIGTDATGNLNAWTQNGGSFSIASNVVTVPNAQSAIMYGGDSDWDDMTFRCRFQFVTSGQCIFTIHVTDQNNYVYVYTDGTGLFIGKRIAGNFTGGIGSSVVSLTAGTQYWIELSAVGTTYTAKAFLDVAGAKGAQTGGTATAVIADSVLSNGKVGISTNSNSVTYPVGGAFAGVCVVVGTAPTGWTPTVLSGEPAFAYSLLQAHAGARSLKISQVAAGSGRWAGTSSGLVVGSGYVPSVWAYSLGNLNGALSLTGIAGSTLTGGTSVWSQATLPVGIFSGGGVMNLDLSTFPGAVYYDDALVSAIDLSKAPQIYEWSERHSAQPTKNHTWSIQILLTRNSTFKDLSPMQDPDDKVIDALWAAQAAQGSFDFVDMDRKHYSVVLLDANEIRLSDVARRRERLPAHEVIYEVEIFEVGS